MNPLPSDWRLCFMSFKWCPTYAFVRHKIRCVLHPRQINTCFYSLLLLLTFLWWIGWLMYEEIRHSDIWIFRLLNKQAPQPCVEEPYISTTVWHLLVTLCCWVTSYSLSQLMWFSGSVRHEKHAVTEITEFIAGLRFVLLAGYSCVFTHISGGRLH